MRGAMPASFPPKVKSGLPKTVAEATEFRSTSLYQDVMRFIEAIQRIDRDVRVETFGTSVEGRPLPLLVVGPPGISDPESARRAGLPVVFIMGNIHAGEVEGKEAALMFLRDLVAGKLSGLRYRMIILIAPIYNADGNEKLSLEHRPTQLGPVGGSGTRENSQGLDLNRDYLKLESPEAQGLIRNVLTRWDPLLTVDLHTTNGSYHGYALTYAPMLTPNAPAELIEFERQRLLPRIQGSMKSDYEQKTYYYGNFLNQLDPAKGWYTFDARPRFGNNYVGLRNRFVILSEAYSYIDFRARIEVTYQFLFAILEAAEKYAKKMMKLTRRADERARARKIKELGVRFEIAPWKKNVEILWEHSEEDPEGGTPDPETGKGSIRRSGKIVPKKMTDFGVFVPTETSPLPAAYLLDPVLEKVAANLLQHGIVVEKLSGDSEIRAAEFMVRSAKHAQEAFQGHHELSLEGKWKEGKRKFPAGTLLVRTDQPLARLIFYLLEPRSDDGLVNWNFVEAPEGKPLPIRKLMRPVSLPATVISQLG